MSIEQVGKWKFEVYPGNTRVGVVVIHEILGLDDYLRSVAKELAGSRFTVAAADLYQGKYARDFEEGMKLRQSLSREEVLDAIGKGVRILKQKLGKTARVGTLGFCMGGGFALLGACNLGLDFCVDYYGMIENADEIDGIAGPVLMFLGSEDARITPWAFQSLLPAAVKHKKRVDVQLYPNTWHAFHRPNWEHHNAEAARDAWSRTIMFLSSFK